MTGPRILSIVNIEAAGGIDPLRLLRALSLRVERLDRGRFRVTGGAEPHYVDLIDRSVERCDCGDFIWRQVVCQHLLACLLREGDERVVNAAARLVAVLVQQNETLRRELRGQTIVVTRTLKSRVARATRRCPDELEFKRDPDGLTAAVEVVCRSTGELLGRVARGVARPEFVTARAEAAVTPQLAA